MHEMPSIEEIRSRIEDVEDEVASKALMYQYIICGRASEVVGKYHPLGGDAQVVDFNGEEAVLFPVQTAKRDGKLRPIAIPLDEKYEPWTKVLFDWFEQRWDRPAFPISMRTLHRRAREAFEGLHYPIEEYSKIIDHLIISGKVEVIRETVYAHWRPMATHALRHIRALQDLMIFYKFEGLDIAIYGGWTSQAVEQQLPAITRRYLHLMPNEMNMGLLKDLASRYFSKLLKPRGELVIKLSQEEK